MAKKSHPDILAKANDIIDRYKPVADHPHTLARHLREIMATKGKPGYSPMTDEEYQDIAQTAADLEAMPDMQP